MGISKLIKINMENKLTDITSIEDNNESDFNLMRDVRLNTFSKSLSIDDNRRKREQHSVLIRKDSITHFVSKKRLISPEEKVENKIQPIITVPFDQSLQQQIKMLLVSLKSTNPSNQLSAATQLRSLYVKSENHNKWEYVCNTDVLNIIIPKIRADINFQILYELLWLLT